MAIYHLSTKVISRSKGQSAVAAAAYRAGVKLVQKVIDAATGVERNKVHNYENKDGVSHKEIVVPERFESVEWLKDRQELWQRVEDGERRKDSQLARQIVIALPKELSEEENIELAVNFAKEVLAKEGMIVDVAVHYDNPDNPHAHLLMTMRDLEFDNDGEVVFGAKNIEWNNKQKMVQWRAAWEKMINHELKVRGFDIEVSAASFKDRGIDLVATQHEGKTRHIERVMRVKEFNEQARLANLEAIRANPEVLIDMIQSRKGVFDRDDVVGSFRDVLFGGCEGRLSSVEEEELVRGVEGIMNSEKLVRVSERGFGGKAMYAGRCQVEREQELVRAATELKSRYGHMVAMHEGGSVDERLSEQQDAVVRGVLESSDLAIVQGLPGAGKSTIAKVIAKEYEKLGYRVFGTAVTAAACKNLHEITDMRVETIAHMKTKWNWLERGGKAIDFGSKDVLVIDEMSMVSLSDMGYLLSKAAENGAKVIALGDVNQFAAIKEHGAASKLVEIADVFELNQVKRMKNPQHRKAAEMMADKKIEEAIEVLDKQGVFKLSSNRLIARENLVLDYVSKYGELVEGAKEKYLGLNKKMVVLAHTNKEVRALNKMIRSELKSLGVLDAQDKQIKVGSKRMSFAIGEQVVFGKNDKTLGVINGDVGVVIGISEFEEYSGGRYANVKVRLSTGKKVTIDTKEYRDISYGYAITAYKAQGGTYDHVYVVHEKGLKYEAFNVMMTRHEQSLSIYVNDEDLKIKSILQDAKRLEVAQKLVNSLSKYNDKALVIDYDFESVEAKNIQHYLSIKAEVREEVELFNKWKKTQIAEKGFVPKSSAYENMDSFIHKVALRKAAAELILDDFSKHRRLLRVAGVSRSLLEIHAESKERDLEIKHFRLVSSNWQKNSVDLTKKWLEHQDDLIDKLASKEIELNSLQVEHEADELKSKYFDHYVSSHKTYLERIYKDEYYKVHDKWKELEKKYGEEKLVQMVNNKPSLLGSFKGKLGWYDADEERKEAERLAVNIGNSMSVARANDKNMRAHYALIREKCLKEKIERLSLEVSDMEKMLASKKDYKFMNSLRLSPEVLEQKTDLIKWRSLILESSIVDSSLLEGLIEEVEFKQIASLQKNIWRYKSIQNGLRDLSLRMADCLTKDLADYPGSRLFLDYHAELKVLRKLITKEKGWEDEVSKRGIWTGTLDGKLDKEKKLLESSLSKNLNKGDIAKLAEVYLEGEVERYHKLVGINTAYRNLDLEFKSKISELEETKNVIKWGLNNLSKVYVESPQEVLDSFNKLYKSEGNKAFEIVQQDPGALGTFRGFGIGKIVRTMDRVEAHELSQGVAASIKNIFKQQAQERRLGEEIIKGNYEERLDKLRDKNFKIDRRLDVEDLGLLMKLKSYDFDNKGLALIERLSGKEILYKDKILGLKKQIVIKQEVLKFDDVVKQLRPRDYERIFRQYAGNIVDGKENIRMHGSSISYGSLNMNLDNGLWIRFSTGESGNIFHFVQMGEGVDKVRSLQIVADQVGCGGLNATFIKKDELQPVEPEVKQEQRLVPIAFNEELTKEAFEERFAYLCSANRLEVLHKYCDYHGNILGYAARLVDKQSGKKQVLPVAYLYDKEENKTKVALKAFTDQKLIYGLEKLHDNKTVLIVEGEKTADIAQQLFPEMNVISWLGGSNSAHKVDWSCVHNKQVVIWPDNDAPGVKAAEIIHDRLSAFLNPSCEKISIIDVKNLDLPKKWDLADQLPEHLSKENVKELVSIHDKDYCLKQIKEQAKEIALELEQKFEKLLDPEDELKVHSHRALQQFKHPRLNKDILRNIVTENVFEATLKNNNLALSEEQIAAIYKRLEPDIEKMAYEYESLSYEQIKLDPDSFKRFYSKKGPTNELLLQEIRHRLDYESRIREMGDHPRDRDIAKDFDKMLEQAHENHFVRELSKVDKDIAQSVAEQMADYGLKHGMHNLTTKRLEIMHDIAKEEHKYLDVSLQKHLDHNKELEMNHDQFKELHHDLGRAFRDHMLHDYIHHRDKVLDIDHHHDLNQMHHDHHNMQHQHHHDIANRLAERAIEQHLEHMQRQQLERELVIHKDFDMHFGK